MLGQARGFEPGNFLSEDLEHRRILIAHVDEDFLCLDGPRGDQHALEKFVRLALEVVAILEGAGLALVAVDGHQARAFFGPHEGPLAARRKAGTAEAAQAAVGERGDHLLGLALAREARPEDAVAAGFHVRVEVLEGRHFGMHVAAKRQVLQLGGVRMVNMMMADLGGRRRIARADAGRPDDANSREVSRLHFGQQLLGAGEHATQTVADADGHLRRALLVVAYDVEVRVEGGDLVHFGHRDPQFFRKRMQVPGREAALAVLDQVQVLDQERPLAGPVAQQGADSGDFPFPEHASARKRRRLATTGAGVDRTFAGFHRCVCPEGRAVIHAQARDDAANAACGGPPFAIRALALWHTICHISLGCRASGWRV